MTKEENQKDIDKKDNKSKSDPVFSDNVKFEESNNRGIRAILQSSSSNYERLPMLDIVYDRLVRMVATSFRSMTQNNVEVSLEGITSVKLQEYLDSLEVPSVISIFKAEEWDGYGMTSIDSNLVYSMVDILLGGDSDSVSNKVQNRAFTTIELNLIKTLVELTLNDLSMAFDPVTAVNFSYDRLETNPKFAAITRFSNPVIIARLRVDMEGQGGVMDVVIPYVTLDPVKEYLQQLFIGERYGRDTAWENYFATKIYNTEIELKTVIKEKNVSLVDVSRWEKGSFLDLDMSPEDDVKVLCSEKAIFDGTMGRKGNNIVVKIKGKSSQDE